MNEQHGIPPAEKVQEEFPSNTGERIRTAGMMGAVAALGVSAFSQEPRLVSAGYQPYDGKFKRKINKNRSKARAAKKSRQRNRR